MAKQIATDSVTASMIRETTPDGATPLRSRSWEVFCGAATGYAGGDPVTATDAYLAAYPKTFSRAAARANAARLAARPEVSARCAWMRAQLAQSVLMDSAFVRAKITGLRLDIIDRTQHTCHKKLALEAARDLEKGLGLTDAAPRGGAGDGETFALEAVTLNIRKLISADRQEVRT